MVDKNTASAAEVLLATVVPLAVIPLAVILLAAVVPLAVILFATLSRDCCPPGLLPF